MSNGTRFFDETRTIIMSTRMAVWYGLGNETAGMTTLGNLERACLLALSTIRFFLLIFFCNPVNQRIRLAFCSLLLFGSTGGWLRGRRCSVLLAL